MKRIGRATRVLIISATCLAMMFIAVSVLFAWMFTAPNPQAVGVAGDLPFAADSVEFRTTDGLMIRGWYAPSSADSGVVILLHGYRGNRTHMIARAEFLRDAGYGVLLYDARGCGTSDGSMVSMGYYESQDLLAAIRFLRERGERNIACIGTSQGGATIAIAAEKLDGLRGAICESTYDDLDHAIDRRFRHYVFMPGWLGACMVCPVGELLLGCDLRDIAPVQSIGKLPCPVYIMSGTSDTRVWTEDTRRLFDAAPEPRQLWLVPGADHVDLYRFAPDDYRNRVLTFLAGCMNDGR